MTRQILSSIFLFLFVHAPNSGSVKYTEIFHKKINYVIETSMTTSGETSHHTPASLPAHEIGLKPGAHKIHVMSMDELAHIHRFHKERVKKIKRHHHKFWLIAKTLVIICHVALLVSAFLHLTH